MQQWLDYFQHLVSLQHHSGDVALQLGSTVPAPWRQPCEPLLRTLK